jgi:hypothetical protein
MTERSSGQDQGRPGNWSNGGYGASQPQYGTPQPQYGASQPQYGASQPQYGASQPQYGAAETQYGAPETQMRSDPTAGWGAAGGTAGTSHAASRSATQSKGFLASLFDFSFTSFITTKIIKVIYVLVTILIFLGALAYTITAFAVSKLVGIGVLIIGDPLFIIIGMALWRISLEFIVVFFRMADDVKALRDRGDVR